MLAAREATVKNRLPRLRGTGKCSFDENIALNFAGFFLKGVENNLIKHKKANLCNMAVGNFPTI